MGDLILSTPVIRVLRAAFPDAYLGMMIQPAYRELIEGHPDLNAVILFDKDGREKSWAGTLRFAQQLKSHRFDTVIILHSTNRVILVSWLAGIRRRIGYARRIGWLLTDRVPYVKREGNRHELDYNLDLLNFLGVKSPDRSLHIAAVTSGQEKKAADFLRNSGVNGEGPLIAIHPGASCPSKRWPEERYAAVADRLIERYGARVIVVTSAQEERHGKEVIRRMKHPAIPAFGAFTLGELAALFKRAACLISNDSGPAHLASAVGTPVVSIFGRWGGGLSPVRWGPTNSDSVVLHHDIGCRPCLAHNCTIGFQCLQAVSVEEVLAAAEHFIPSSTSRVLPPAGPSAVRPR